MRIIRDPEKVQIIVEKSRWEIWNLLRKEGRMSADVLAEKVGKNISTIYRHLKKLSQAGFVKEHDVQRGHQKYITKEYSAEMTDAFFILSEEAESLIANQPGEISYLENSVPTIISYFKSIGLEPASKADEEKAREIMRRLLIKLSSFIGDLIGEEDKENLRVFNHEFEVMRRFLALFLTQIDDEFNREVSKLRKILLKK
ncbi:MAG: winged helix-turn-helix transcriptional regulator [Candidatus Hodarchaeales archaeon]